jgi:hypothetical protein
MALVMSGLYDKLEELRQLYGPDLTIEEILDGIISRKQQLNRLVKLQSKVMVSAGEQTEIRLLQRNLRRYVYNLAKEKAQARLTSANNGKAKSALRT